MKSTIEILIKYLGDPIPGEGVPLKKEFPLFCLNTHQTSKTQKKSNFLKELQRYNRSGRNIDNEGSGVYFFKAGSTIFEIEVLVGEYIEIHPFLRFNASNIKHDFEKIILLDYLLYCVLKEQGLQPETP